MNHDLELERIMISNDKLVHAHYDIQFNSLSPTTAKDQGHCSKLESTRRVACCPRLRPQGLQGQGNVHFPEYKKKKKAQVVI